MLLADWSLRSSCARLPKELLVLDRLVYRNRSQHRSAKYFTLILEVFRIDIDFTTLFLAHRYPKTPADRFAGRF